MSIAFKKFNIVKHILSKSTQSSCSMRLFDHNIIHKILSYYWNILDGKIKVLLPWININKLYCDELCKNINAIDLLREKIKYEKSLTDNEYYKLSIYHNVIDWEYMSSNPNAIPLLLDNYYKIDWNYLCLNKNAIFLLKENIDKINWNILSSNPNAISLLEENIDKIDWNILSANPNAISLLEKNKEHINWYNVSSNPSIFVYENMPDI